MIFSSILTGISIITSWLFILLGCFFIFTGAIGFLRMKDFFIKLHAVILSNCYGLTFILIGFMIHHYYDVSFLKFSIIVILNIIVTLTSVHTIGRRAYIEGVDMNANKRDEA